MTALLEGDERRSRAAVNELVNYGLLERRDDHLHIGHALIHQYAARHLALSREALERVAAYYIEWCETQSEAGLEGYARLDGERAHCLRLMEACLKSELWQEVKALMEEIREYLDRQGWWTEGLAAREMTLTAVQRSNNRKDEGLLLNVLARTYIKYGEQTKALIYCKQSLAIRREAGDRKGEARTLNNIAKVYAAQGKHKQALKQYQQSLMIEREIGDRKGEGWTLNNLAMLAYAQGDYETALTHLHESLLIRKEVGDKIGEGTTLNNIAVIYRVQGNPAKALEYHERAFVICRELGDRAGEAGTHWNIGLACEDQGDLVKAEKCISHAVQLMDTSGDPEVDVCRKALEQVRAARQGA